MASDSVAERTQSAVRVREGLVKLGPTFIRIGQQLSTRVDVLSLEFVKELEKLQVANSCALSRLQGYCINGSWQSYNSARCLM